MACTACALRFTDPLPTDEELTRLYEEEYYEYAYDRNDDDRQGADGQKPAVRKRGLVSIRTLTHLFKAVLFAERRRALLDRPPGRVLDVGCGNGDFLRPLNRRGWEVHGVEYSAEAAELARAKGISVHHGDLTSAAFPERYFDVVTLWHVAEHLPDPITELAEVRRILRDDGLLVLEVPNSDSLTRTLCGARWKQLDIPRHLQHFTPKSLEHLLSRAGFARIHRRNFHVFDFNLVFYNLIERLGISRLTGIQYFSTDFKRASQVSRTRFLVLGLPIAFFCLPYSVLEAKLGGNGENVTITARKTAG